MATKTDVIAELRATITEQAARIETLEDINNAYSRDVEKAVAEMVKAGIGEHSPEAAVSLLAFQRDEAKERIKALESMGVTEACASLPGVMEYFQQCENRISQFEAEADPDALHIAYLHGVADKKALERLITDQHEETLRLQARIKALERLVDLDAITLSESNDLLRYRIVQLEEEAKFNFDQYQDMAAEHCKAADEYEKRIAQLEGALRVSRGALNSQFIVGCGAWQIEQKNAIAKINELIGE